uniref:Uncharacterized protein n=1 Tax=Arundo donax TaxID=35708 RepID=A0A0A9GG20_ARUDO
MFCRCLMDHNKFLLTESGGMHAVKKSDTKKAPPLPSVPNSVPGCRMDHLGHMEMGVMAG